MRTVLLRVSLPYGTFGLVVDVGNKVIIEAPPIARWSLGRNYQDVVNYYLTKGATVTAV